MPFFSFGIFHLEFFIWNFSFGIFHLEFIKMKNNVEMKLFGLK